MPHLFSPHQQAQVEIINQIAKAVETNSLSTSIVEPVADFAADRRLCLTSVHFPHQELIQKIEATLIEPLKKIAPEHFYFPNDSLHITIKNLRVVADPPKYTLEDIARAQNVFSQVIPITKSFQVYFYRLLLFPNSLALIGTTDPEFDQLIFTLNKQLSSVNLVDDKKYLNEKCFFCNLTLARFNQPVSTEFRQKVAELSQACDFAPYLVDSVTLLTGNGVMMKKILLSAGRYRVYECHNW